MTVQDEEPEEDRQLDGSRITAAGVHPRWRRLLIIRRAASHCRGSEGGR